jgi:putative flippase GtrA
LRGAVSRKLPALFLRYAGVGAGATLAHWALLAVWVECLHGPAWIGSGLGATLGAQLAFFGNRAWTFEHREALAPAWWRFMGTAAVGAAFGMAAVAAAVALGAHYLLAQALATGLGLVLTFAINRRWTFRRRA